MGPHDGAVDHQVLIVAIGRQRVENPLPDAGIAPAAEAAMDCLPFAVAFRQCAPERSIHKHPFTNNRLSLPVRPGSPALPGSRGATIDHGTSFNSYRFTPMTGLRDHTVLYESAFN
jgi:hypothetical protein